jgi:hypothetical protein
MWNAVSECGKVVGNLPGEGCSIGRAADDVCQNPAIFVVVDFFESAWT